MQLSEPDGLRLAHELASARARVYFANALRGGTPRSAGNTAGAHSSAG